jgi:hypothetical protein
VDLSVDLDVFVESNKKHCWILFPVIQLVFSHVTDRAVPVTEEWRFAMELTGYMWKILVVM